MVRSTPGKTLLRVMNQAGLFFPFVALRTVTTSTVSCSMEADKLSIQREISFLRIMIYSVAFKVIKKQVRFGYCVAAGVS